MPIGQGLFFTPRLIFAFNVFAFGFGLLFVVTVTARVPKHCTSFSFLVLYSFYRLLRNVTTFNVNRRTVLLNVNDALYVDDDLDFDLSLLAIRLLLTLLDYADLLEARVRRRLLSLRL